MRKLSRPFFLLSFALGSWPLSAREPLFQSSANQTALIELYTSEGCSSCPPAEDWLSSLATHPQLWKDFVPVAFHVDYWNQLGWPDRYASAAFTNRQQAYAARWKSGSVYTPGFVLNGSEWRPFAGPRLPRASSSRVGVLSLEPLEQSRIRVKFAPEKASPSQYDVSVALLGSDISSRVARGENAGRELHHWFVALSLQQAPLNEHDETEVQLPKMEPDIRYSLAAWVSPRGELAPIQAVGGWLNDSPAATRN